MFELITDQAETDGWCLVIGRTLYVWKRPEMRLPRVTWRRDG
ncbi:MAG TPA: hypothetical protein VGI66_17925 [Streptosporangiaceae bacterium]|jgi:hypothetical protein